MNSTVEKRLLAMLLAIVMIVPMFLVGIEAKSYGPVNVCDDKLKIESSAQDNSELSYSNGTVTATSNYTEKTNCGSASTYTGNTATVTITNISGANVTVKFSYSEVAGVKSITFNSPAVKNDNTITVVLAQDASYSFSFTGNDENVIAKITLQNFEVIVDANVTVTMGEVVNGTYTVNDVVAVPGETISASTTTAIKLVATPAEGYTFSGWFDTVTGECYATSPSVELIFEIDATIYPAFVLEGEAVFAIGSAKFDSLDAALAIAKKGDVIVPIKDVTLTKDYTIPEGITLLVPHDAENTHYNKDNASSSAVNISTSSGGVADVAPSLYRTLTLAPGVVITVYGELNVSGRNVACDGGKPKRGGAPFGNYSKIVMNEGSRIILNSGAELYAWGYIVGSGDVIANSGARIDEVMQITDFRGGTATVWITNTDKSKRFLPFSQYYVQNIEVNTEIHTGASLYATASFRMDSMVKTSTIAFIGDAASGGMFTMEENSVVSKRYDPEADRLYISSAGTVSISSMTVDMGKISLAIISMEAKLNTEDFNLPVNGNITIEIISGTANVTQDLMMLPGSKLIVGEDATINLPADNEVYIFDKDDWGNYTRQGGTPEYTTHVLVGYVGSRGGAPAARDYTGDVIVDINGTINISGKIYTSEGGAEVISSGGTGKIVFVNAAPTSTYGLPMCIKQASSSDLNNTFEDVTMNPASLKNGAGHPEFTSTAGAAAGTVFSYCDVHGEGSGHWVTEPCPVYTISWVVNGDSQSAEIGSWETLAYPGGVPAKAYDATNHYTFAGWSLSEGGEVITLPANPTADATYYAVFTPVAHTDGSKDHICDGGCGYDKIGGSCTDTNPIDHNCDYCGRQMDDHIGGTATCTAKAVCTKCGKPYGEMLAHTYNKEVATDTYLKDAATCTSKAVYYKSCVCGEKGTETFESGEKLAHTYNKEVATDAYLKDAATCTSKAVYYKSCVCGLASTTDTFEFGEMLAHTYNKEVATDAYLKDAATCTSKAVYYKSCECGEKGTETFESGEKLAHTYNKEVATDAYLKDAATCTSKAVYYKSCECGEKGTETFESGEKLAHTYNKEVATDAYLKDAATCTSKAVYYKSCECGEKGTETFESGEIDLANHVGDTEYADITETTHDIKCKSCTNVITDNEAHTYVEGKCACGAEEKAEVTNINVISKKVTNYTVNGNVVTVTHTVACKVGYFNGEKYIAITAVANGDGSYSFTAPEGVTEVLLVVKGDVNGDGNVKQNDASMAKSIFLGTYRVEPTAAQIFAADASGDGNIKQNDATMIKSVFLALRAFPW